LGSRFAGHLTGSFGHLATSSFYPAHHITMGEGGCVLTDRGKLRTLVESFRDWGRDCWCEPGDADTCGKRFDWKLGKLPRGYDHKYIFSHVGYNMKVTDMQAAAGVSQLKKLDRFVRIRRSNFDHLTKALSDLETYFVLPRATEKSEPSWFGFPMSVRPDAGFDRRDLISFLDARNIDTRMLFAGNLARQPAYQDRSFRSVGDLSQTDRVMESTFWIGVYPGLSEAMIDYVADSIHSFCRGEK
jgi:CDP-6-deoxy-D-xylo-4-hexulose-3-dehydrase